MMARPWNLSESSFRKNTHTLIFSTVCVILILEVIELEVMTIGNVLSEYALSMNEEVQITRTEDGGLKILPVNLIDENIKLMERIKKGKLIQEMPESRYYSATEVFDEMREKIKEHFSHDTSGI